jgi:hypothetical protein
MLAQDIVEINFAHGCEYRGADEASDILNGGKCLGNVGTHVIRCIGV